MAFVGGCRREYLGCKPRSEPPGTRRRTRCRGPFDRALSAHGYVSFALVLDIDDAGAEYLGQFRDQCLVFDGFGECGSNTCVNSNKASTTLTRVFSSKVGDVIDGVLPVELAVRPGLYDWLVRMTPSKPWTGTRTRQSRDATPDALDGQRRKSIRTSDVRA